MRLDVGAVDRHRVAILHLAFKDQLGEDAIAISRRWSRQDASFGGVVFGTLRLAYFQSLFTKMSLGKRSVMTLMHTDGTVLMRSSEGENSWILSGDPVQLRIREPREWGATMNTRDHGPFVLAAAVEAPLPSAYNEGQTSDGDRRVLVVGTSTPIRDEFLPQQGQMADADLAGAMAFALNSVDAPSM